MAPALRQSLVALAALSLLACGGEDKGRPSGARVIAPDVDQCALAAGYETQSIVAFENIDDTPTCAGPQCRFYANHDDLTVTTRDELPPSVPKDAVSCLTLAPAELDPEQTKPPGSKSAPGGARCGTSNGVIRFRAINVGQCFGSDGRLGWGASLELKFLVTPSSDVPDPLDASGADGTAPWDGVGFWVMSASETSDVSAILSVNDDASDGKDINSPVNRCGCVPKGDGTYDCYADPKKKVPDSLKCDPFGVAFTVTKEWSFVRARFDEMRQKGFGFPLDGLDISAITRLQFLVGSGSSDFYIDDIVLFREK